MLEVFGSIPMTKPHNPATPPPASEPEAITEVSREELEAKLNAAEAKATQYWDQLLRAQAETENIRRRTERDIANAHKYSLEKFALELLPVLDGIERGLAIPVEHPAAKSMHEGMEMTLNVLLKALEKFGIKQLNPQGESFNPTQQQAIATKADAACPPDTVVEVLQKGYLLQDRLLRPALVVVSKNA